jgi:hypothetical protein
MLLNKSTVTASRVASKAMGATRSMSKDIKFGVEGRAAMLRGVNLLADAVQVRHIDDAERSINQSTASHPLFNWPVMHILANTNTNTNCTYLINNHHDIYYIILYYTFKDSHKNPFYEYLK